MHARAKCPAYGVTCKICGKINNFAWVWRSAQQKPQVNLIGDDSQSEGSDAMWYVSQVNCLDNVPNKWFVNLKLATHNEESLEYDPGQTQKCQPDTGSTVNVMGFTDLQPILQDGNPAVLPSKAILKLYDGTLIRPRGENELKTDHNGTTHKFQIIDRHHRYHYFQPTPARD